MNLFVTGGTGFVGAHFLKQSLLKGLKVNALRLPNTEPSIDIERRPVWIDGSYYDDLRKYFETTDVLVHFAAHTANPPYDDLATCLKWNVDGPLYMFEQAYNAGVRKFLVAGSCFEYGLSGQNYDYIPVNAPLLPNNTYAISKAASSVVLGGWALKNRVMMKYMRISQVFGEGEPNQRLWPALHLAAINGYDFNLTAGEQIRDFIDVVDVAQIFLNGLESWDTTYGPLQFRNIGTGTPQSIREFATHWWKKWGATGVLNFGALPYRENEIMRFVPLVEG